MTRPVFSQKEFEVVGMYPGIESDAFAAMGLPSLPPHPKMNRPISPKENWKLLMEGKKPYWIPQNGWFMCDVNIFRPRVNPDNVAAHLIFDGESQYKYESNVMKSNWFDLEWEFVPSAGGSTVHPGNPKVKDINKWEEYVSMPNLDSIDWERCKKNKDYLDSDKVNRLDLLNGLWERLMAVMDVENAAMAMIDEDEKEGVKRFFDQYADVLIEYIRRMKEILPMLDAVLIHDDWGHQQSTFLSLDTYREMLVPYYKRITDAIHDLGMWFELHSCGKNQTLVPALLEMGVDLWCPQVMNDIDRLVEQYKDESIVFGVGEPPIAPDASEEEIREAARLWVEKYKDKKIVQYFMMVPPSFSQYVYEFSRIAYQDEN